MATKLGPCECVDEDYIDMELSLSPQNRDFEFQMSSVPTDQKQTTTSPADELFYKGKLLPLHLPPRLQMVQKLLHTSSREQQDDPQKLPFFTCSTAPCTNSNTPLDSCNISPSESCRVSCELNPDEYFFEWSTEFSSFINTQHPTKKSWSKKLKLMKNSILAQKLKASRAYLKSLFNKSACSDESSAKAAPNLVPENLFNAEECPSKYIKLSKKKPFGHIGKSPYPSIAAIIKRIDKEGIEDGSVHRRSFSGAIKRHSPTKCLSSSSSNSSSGSSASSSSSFSANSNGFHELHFLKRSSSATEVEGSIEAAIAHCKKSQLAFESRDTSKDAVLKIENQENPGVCL